MESRSKSASAAFQRGETDSAAGHGGPRSTNFKGLPSAAAFLRYRSTAAFEVAFQTDRARRTTAAKPKTIRKIPSRPFLKGHHPPPGVFPTRPRPPGDERGPDLLRGQMFDDPFFEVPVPARDLPDHVRIDLFGFRCGAPRPGQELPNAAPRRPGEEGVPADRNGDEQAECGGRPPLSGRREPFFFPRCFGGCKNPAPPSSGGAGRALNSFKISSRRA